ncbi:hypothetical protein [Streptomyces sp. NPDC088789]|uniref:hypothetical protein n=1 Tax=Streptomyces sp. NPDC088789 TaxID=3365899 RepID=UPI0037F35ACC
MALDISGLLNEIVSHAMASGHFERVNAHEPENPPGYGLTCAIWSNRITAIRSSGLDSITARVEVTVRIMSPMFDPPDAIDPTVIAAVDDLCAAYSGDFTLGGLVRHVDLLGAHGTPLDVRAGYLQQDGMKYRVMDITLPLIVNDLWTEAP